MPTPTATDSATEGDIKADHDAAPPRASDFVITKQHRRFAEFCDAVRRERYIGLCPGAPGVGKTLSARHYSRWDTVGPALEMFRFGETPILSWAIGTIEHPDRAPKELIHLYGEVHTELIIINEVDRLKNPSLEALRDHHDRTGVGLVLIGMPGIERRLARYPQLYSRVGFLHHYQPLSSDEQTFVLSRRWPDLGLHDNDDFATNEARAAVLRVTSGNFRLTIRLMAQIHRIMEINQLSMLTSEVVDAARDSLVIGVM